MTDRSRFQRFTAELRRRHVPQTAAVYLVAAWAAIEFADVIVPNLDGPQWVVIAVIVAAGVGLPVVLVLAWIYDWGPEGVHRTDAPPQLESGHAQADLPARSASSAPWMIALAVLAVGIASALAVAALVSTDGPEEPEGAGVVRDETEEARERRGRRDLLVPPDFGLDPDSFRREVQRSIGDVDRLERLGVPGRHPTRVDTMTIGDLTEWARSAAAETGLGILIREPSEWVLGRGLPVPLAEGDTLEIEGVAQDTAGVTAVQIDGTTVARSDDPDEILRFTGRVVGTGALGTRTVTIRVRTADGREITRGYQVLQRPPRAVDGDRPGHPAGDGSGHPTGSGSGTP